MALFGSGKKNFQRDSEEISLRSYWLANKVCAAAAAAAQYGLTAVSAWIDDEQFRDQDQRIFSEILGYIMAFVLDRLRDDIEKHHGWTDDTYDLNIDYQASLGVAFNRVFGLRLRKEGSSFFTDLFQQYYSPEYGYDYDEYWGISNEVTDEDMNKTLGELVRDTLNDPKTDEEYNVDRLYTYRLSKIVNVVDRDKVIGNAQTLYRSIGLTYYDKAFFDLSLKKIVSELKDMMNQ
jgi:hypothetical protein